MENPANYEGRRITVVFSVNETISRPLLLQSIFSLCFQGCSPHRICIISHLKVPAEQAADMVRENTFLKDTRLDVFHFESASHMVPKRLHEVLEHCDSEYIAFLQQDEVLYHDAFESLSGALAQTSKAVAIGSFRAATVASLTDGVHISAKESIPHPDIHYLRKSGWKNTPLAAFLLSRRAAELETFNLPLTRDWPETLLTACLTHPHPAYDLSGQAVCEKRILQRVMLSEDS